MSFRPLVRPYAITAIGDPGSLGVEFADNDGGGHLQLLKNNYNIRGDIQDDDELQVPGEPTLSLQNAQPVDSAVTKKATRPTTPPRATIPIPTRTTAPKTTETSP